MSRKIQVGAPMMAKALGTGPAFARPGDVCVIVGGIGSIIGTLIVAHIIGFMEVITTSLIAAELRGVFTMALIILVLVIRPQGLFGRAEL